MEELRAKLPDFDILDKEFGKNFEKVYDIFASTMNKYLTSINRLQDDLLQYMRKKLIPLKWDVKKGFYLNPDNWPRCYNGSRKIEPLMKNFGLLLFVMLRKQ